MTDPASEHHGSSAMPVGAELAYELCDAMIGIQAQLDEIHHRLDHLEHAVSTLGETPSRRGPRSLAGRARRALGHRR